MFEVEKSSLTEEEKELLVNNIKKYFGIRPDETEEKLIFDVGPSIGGRHRDAQFYIDGFMDSVMNSKENMFNLCTSDYVFIETFRLNKEEKKRLTNLVKELFDVKYEESSTRIGFNVCNLSNLTRKNVGHFISGFMCCLGK